MKGHRQDARVRAAVGHWSASKRAELHYTMAVLQIMGAAHKGILEVVEREHLTPLLHTDAKTPAGLGPKLLQKITKWQRPRIEASFDVMAGDVSKKSAAAATLYGIAVRHVAGVDSTIAHAREANVQLITNATADFLDQVRQTLDDTEGQTADEIRKALTARVGVSNSRGALIARTSTTTVNSQIAQARQRAAGITSYRWSGSLDSRERELHLALEGQIISWDDPPVTEENGDRNHAGESYNCRCVPVVYLPELEDDDEDGAAEAAE